MKTVKKIVDPSLWGLGFVSLFNDLSSEVIARVLPLYLITVLNASFVSIGVVEAIADATSVLGKLFAGYWSDLFGRRKPLVFLGYFLSVISRPLILLTPTVVIISFARFFDKVGKSIRVPPRDALIADLSDASNRGQAFGINRALDTAGAVIGLFAVYLYLHFSPSSDSAAQLRIILVGACVAGVAALFVLLLMVKEPVQKKAAASKKPLLAFSSLNFPTRNYLLVALFFALASSSDAFLILRAKELGFNTEQIFLILVGFNLVSAIFAYILSSLSDSWGRKPLLFAGWALYSGCYFLMGWSATSKPFFIFAMMVYGLFYSFTDGVEKAFVADLTLNDVAVGNKSGQAYGWLGVVQGCGVIPANLLFAYIYGVKGAWAAFSLSGIFAAFGALLLVLMPGLRNTKLRGESHG